MELSVKKTVLILCDWFLPGYLAGGPIQSIATLTKHLEKQVNFKIITTDRDFKADKPYQNIVCNKWTSFEGREVFYLSPDKLKPNYILKLIHETPHDAIYLNSLFSKFFTIYPLKWKQQGKINSKIILAPRGMLGDGALSIKSFKKKIFLSYAKIFGLFNYVYWQSTSNQETLEIKNRVSKKANIFEISNLPNLSSETEFVEKNANSLKLCFISRISEKKNLNYCIDILKSIKSFQIEFDIYGPIEDENYWNICKENINDIPKNISIKYKGVLEPKQISNSIQQYHALFLPTKNENYGHIIVETFQSSRPVIISDQTPWRDLKTLNIGYDISLNNKKEYIEAIEYFSQLNQNDFNAICINCNNYINKHFNLNELKLKYIKLFCE